LITPALGDSGFPLGKKDVSQIDPAFNPLFVNSSDGATTSMGLNKYKALSKFFHIFYPTLRSTSTLTLPPNFVSFPNSSTNNFDNLQKLHPTTHLWTTDKKQTKPTTDTSRP
jgi:hypothetical protein